MPAMLPTMIAAHLVLAQDLPQLDVAPSCQATADAAIRQGNRSADACLRDEQRARQTLHRDWGDYGKADRVRCLRLSNLGGKPSYVELLTCLELAKSSEQLPSEDKLNGLGGGNR